MDINNGYDRHLDPPDEPEAEYCEDCGKEMEYRETLGDHWTFCSNPFCPGKFSTEKDKEMAEKITEQEDTIERLEHRVKFLSQKIQRLENKNVQS